MPYQKMVAVINKIKQERPKKPVSTNLTPVTIMVVDVISAVRSRKLPRVQLDSGSTTTLINENA